jgi:uncharacterized protein affecting Mg2+/Co2+ transport
VRGVIGLVVALMLAMLVLASCSSGAQQALDKRLGTPTAAPAPATQAAGAGAPAAGASPAAAAAGSPVASAASGAVSGEEKVSGGVALRLNGVQFLEKGSYVSPKDGMVFMALDVTVKNQGQQEVTVGSRALQLKDGQGNELRRNMTGATKPSPQSTIAPGAESRGELTFEVPVSMTSFQLVLTGGDGAAPATFDIKR